MHTPAQRRNQIVVSPDRCQLLAHAAVAVRRPHTHVKPQHRAPVNVTPPSRTHARAPIPIQIDLSLGITS